MMLAPSLASFIGYLTINAVDTECAHETNKRSQSARMIVALGISPYYFPSALLFTIFIYRFCVPYAPAYLHLRIPNTPSRVENQSRSDIPNLDTEDIKLLPLVGQWFITKGLAVRADTLLKARV